MGKFGRKNEVNLNPLNYNIGLIGEGGIGKTTLIYEVCEKLLGSNGYIFLEIGKEDGADSIESIVWEPVENWEKFEEVCDDIIENKTTDYPDLKVVVIDTFDQLVEIAKPEVIAMHNRENPEKPITSIKQAFGGFMAGEDKALEIILNKMWELKKVGVRFIAIGHTKKKDMEDPVTGETYSILTTDMSNRDFNKLKTKLHFLGVACVDREIIKKKTGKQNLKTKKEEVKGFVKAENRKITFRDDNYSIDSKSRFADIVDSIPLNADAFIKALQNAILVEHNKKSNKSIEETKEEQEKAEKEKEATIAKMEDAARDKKVIDLAISKASEFITKNKTEHMMDRVKPFVDKCDSIGYKNPKSINNVKAAKKVIEFIKEFETKER